MPTVDDDHPGHATPTTSVNVNPSTVCQRLTDPSFYCLGTPTQTAGCSI
ncbi:hypothetical protein ACLUXQ_05810 [Limosilactobacillus mucosae]|nr:hypothetical protein [Lactobacillus sp. MRS-253-APC-2B]MDD6453807.1 hypothetical protein [Lactobacillus sp.]MDD6864843.1 hypothetical protein [Lactobacillus sp.]MDF9444851.1 hypothetical protein [Limosilactobacillus mucosae]NME34553.1 hypothetical protein [Lactobacillus sp. MRS-253-APC-2B]